MVLVDTSIWVDYLRQGDAQLSALLEKNQVYMHPMIIGELACGHLKNRQSLLELWQALPQAKEAMHDEVLYFIEQHQLMGRGIGFIDLHLLSTTLLISDTSLWTRDRRLKNIAIDLNCCWFESH